MGLSTGIPETHLRKFFIVAWQRNAILIVRHMHPSSLDYVGRPGYQPRPAAVGAKTADRSATGLGTPPAGQRAQIHYDVAGLVVHPSFQPSCHRGDQLENAHVCWAHTMESLAPSMVNASVDLAVPHSWSAWGVDRPVLTAPQWRWRVDIDPQSPRFGCLQLCAADRDWCYVHDDYELKDVIVLGGAAADGRPAAAFDGFGTSSPASYEQKRETIRRELNELLGAEMVQRRADARLARHGPGPVTIVFPDWQHLVLADAIEVGRWYLALDRDELELSAQLKLSKYSSCRRRMAASGSRPNAAPKLSLT